MKTKIICCACLLVLLLSGLNGQSGGGFEITEAVVATGGGPAQAGNVDVDSTTGQSIAGGGIAAGNFSITSGFWNYTSLAPTAASVTISGRVLSQTGAGVTGALLYLQTEDGELLIARSSSFGHYRFDSIISGQTVVISVQARRFTYAPRTAFAIDEITGFDFIPEQ